MGSGSFHGNPLKKINQDTFVGWDSIDERAKKEAEFSINRVRVISKCKQRYAGHNCEKFEDIPLKRFKVLNK